MLRPGTVIGRFDSMITEAVTTPVTKSPEPERDPTEKNIPVCSLPAADTEVRTSGAPFPIASKVTPANDSDIPRVDATFSNAGERKASAVVPTI